MKEPKRDLLERLEGAAQACHAAHILSCEATCREAAEEIARLRKLKEVPSEKGDSATDKRDAARWRFLEHGCQWVGFTPTGGDTRSFDPRNVSGYAGHLLDMRETVDAELIKQLALLKEGAEKLKRSLK